LNQRFAGLCSNFCAAAIATVAGIGRQQLKLRFDNKRELALPCSELRHVDYGFASTSDTAQGATVDRVIVNADSMRNAQLVNRKQFMFRSIAPATMPRSIPTTLRSCDGGSRASRARQLRLRPPILHGRPLN